VAIEILISSQRRLDEPLDWESLSQWAFSGPFHCLAYRGRTESLNLVFNAALILCNMEKLKFVNMKYTSEKAIQLFGKACGYHRGVMPNWQCGNEGACIRTLSAAHSAEMFALGWQ